VNCPMQRYFHFVPDPEDEGTAPAHPAARRK
jgi:hypothetical protein